MRKQQKKNYNFITWTEAKLEHQESKVNVRILGSLLVMIASILPFLNQLYTFDFSENYGWHDSDTLVWMLTQSMAPILIVLAVFLRPYKIAFFVPVQ